MEPEAEKLILESLNVNYVDTGGWVVVGRCRWQMQLCAG
jgi:hypothetical protein